MVGSMVFRSRSCSVSILVVAALLVQGCAHTMMKPPNYYLVSGVDPFEQLDPGLTGSQVELLYITDRSKESDSEGNLKYGHGRSPSIAYGTAVVELGRNLSWESLLDYTRGLRGAVENPSIKVLGVEEQGRFPKTPYSIQVLEGGRVEPAPEVTAQQRQAEMDIRRAINKRLALVPRKEVILGIHGVHNDFDDAMISTAEMWHFTGRGGIPIAYTWPAGAPGLFFYNTDRESGEFTVLHLKQLLKVLATIPEIEKTHVIAHSRGTDVAMTALRELVIEARAAGIDPRDYYKIDNVVLAAADIDIEVASQRLAGEALGSAVGHFTLYTNLKDSAISAAKSLFSSRLRLGAINPEKLTPLQSRVIEEGQNLDIIMYGGSGGGLFRHSYVRNPAISSDLLMLLNYGWLPGQGGRKALQPVGPNIWKLDDQYPE